MTAISHQIDKRTLARSDAPYLAAPLDPAFIKHRYKTINWGKSRKVLTYIKYQTILKIVINRKDDNMATKAKIQTNYMQNIAVWLLAAGAILGIADLLGGGLRAFFIASLLIVSLLVMALDYRK